MENGNTVEDLEINLKKARKIWKMGALEIVDGEISGGGYCTVTDQDGDKITG